MIHLIRPIRSRRVTRPHVMELGAPLVLSSRPFSSPSGRSCTLLQSGASRHLADSLYMSPCSALTRNLWFLVLSSDLGLLGFIGRHISPSFLPVDALISARSALPTRPGAHRALASFFASLVPSDQVLRLAAWCVSWTHWTSLVATSESGASPSLELNSVVGSSPYVSVSLVAD